VRIVCCSVQIGFSLKNQSDTSPNGIPFEKAPNSHLATIITDLAYLGLGRLYVSLFRYGCSIKTQSKQVNQSFGRVSPHNLSLAAHQLESTILRASAVENIIMLLYSDLDSLENWSDQRGTSETEA